MSQELSLLLGIRSLVFFIILSIIATTARSLYFVCVTFDDDSVKLSSEESLVSEAKSLDFFVSYRVILIASCVMFFLSHEVHALIGHVSVTGATLTLLVLTSVLFVATMKFFFFKSNLQWRTSPYMILACYVIFVLCCTLWTVNSMLSLILIIDSLNITLYILFFNSVVDSSNLVSSISTFFWTAFLSTILFFFFMISFYLSYASTDSSLAVMVISLTNFLNNGAFLRSFCFMLLISFVCIKMGLAPFFHWKVLLLKAVSVRAACFYVIFYFSAVFLFFAKVLLCGTLLFITTTGSSYFILMLAVLTLFAFNTPNATIAKFLTYSSAINGALVIALCMSVSFIA